MVCFQRPELLAVIEALKDQKEYEVVCDEKLGLVLRAPGGASVAAEMLDFDGAIDPMTGWTLEAARRSPMLGLCEPGAVAVRGPSSDLFGALLVSHGTYPAFFAVLPRDPNTGLFSLRAMPYPHLSPEEVAAALAGPEVWPPQPAQPESQALPSIVSGGFELDPAADACEEVHKRSFVATGRAPAVGHGLFLHVAFGTKLALPWVRMAGSVTEVGPLPAADAPVDPVLGESFFKQCTCGKQHPREEVLRELGTIHGQRIKGVVYLTKEFVGRLPELAGQWDVVLVADDHKQFVWQMERMTPRPRDQWIPRD